MKYIDTEKLKELIEAKYKEYVDMSKQTYAALQYQYIADGLDIAEQLIDSLQQEQTNVDLEKEIKDYFDSQPIITRSKGVDYRLIPTGVDIAKHFFELGLKTKENKL